MLHQQQLRQASLRCPEEMDLQLEKLADFWLQVSTFAASLSHALACKNAKFPSSASILSIQIRSLMEMSRCETTRREQIVTGVMTGRGTCCCAPVAQSEPTPTAAGIGSFELKLRFHIKASEWRRSGPGAIRRGIHVCRSILHAERSSGCAGNSSSLGVPSR